MKINFLLRLLTKCAIVASIALCISSAAHAIGETTSRGRMATITGTVESIYCELDESGGEPRYQGCSISCGAADNAVGLIDSAGTFYVLTDRKSKRPLKTALKNKGGTVAVTGILYEEEGFTAILQVHNIH